MMFLLPSKTRPEGIEKTFLFHFNPLIAHRKKTKKHSQHFLLYKQSLTAESNNFLKTKMLQNIRPSHLLYYFRFKNGCSLIFSKIV